MHDWNMAFLGNGSTSPTPTRSHFASLHFLFCKIYALWLHIGDFSIGHYQKICVLSFVIQNLSYLQGLR